MTPQLLAAAVLAAAPALAEDSGQRFLIVTHEALGDGLISYSVVYDTEAEAEMQAERIALCGFWRVNPDPTNPERSLVAHGAVRQIFPRSLEGAPPLSPDIEAMLPLELPPPPTVDSIIDCAAAQRARLRPPKIR